MMVDESRFLSTPSARRATEDGDVTHHAVVISIHALREEGDERYAVQRQYVHISIHALREEGDAAALQAPPLSEGFLSTPSARRATLRMLLNSALISLFLSTPSARRATMEEASSTSPNAISIHALREEGDQRASFRLMSVKTFLSTPSARRATFDGPTIYREEPISIHALREEGDRCCPRGCTLSGNFYPRPPRGGRQLPRGNSEHVNEFLSTPSARRATRTDELSERISKISIHALREEGDKLRKPQWIGVAKFLSTPSARRATPA